VTAPVDTGRTLLLDLYDAAVSAAAPGPVTARAVDALPIDRDRRVWILAFGKAAEPMAAAAVGSLLHSRHSIVGGVMVTSDAAASPYPTLLSLRGDHPIPGRHSVASANRLGDVIAARRGNDVVIVLISGGTSSMIGAPLRGMAESDLALLYEMLLGAGLDIRTMNAVRKRFSRWAAGRLALALAPAAMHCLAISDVPDDDLSVIGSGPCVPDTTTIADVKAILERVDLLVRIPQTYRDYLAAVARGSIPETLGPSHPAFAHVAARVIGNVRLAVAGAAARAREHGASAEIVDTLLSGEAAAAGESIARQLLTYRIAHGAGGGPSVTIWGGEPTVTLSRGSGAHPTGGGRCQELALAAARVLHDARGHTSTITILAAGTDGRDGATDAAGACVDSSTWRTIAAAGRDPAAALAAHESFGALRAANALVPRRDTGTNVTDVVIGLVA